jgi:hypothetical protein
LHFKKTWDLGHPNPKKFQSKLDPTSTEPNLKITKTLTQKSQKFENFSQKSSKILDCWVKVMGLGLLGLVFVGIQFPRSSWDF